MDEYRIRVVPVLVGSGKHLFGVDATHVDLRLVTATTFDGGVTSLVYQPV